MRHYFLFVSILFLSSPSLAVFTKADAVQMLKKNGIRWKQIDYLPQEAELTHKQSEIALEPHFEMNIRQLGTRADLRKYGFTNQDAGSFVGYGAAVLEGEFALLDKKSYYQEIAAKINVDIQKENREQYHTDLTYAMLLTYLNCQRLTEKVKLYDVNMERNKKIVDMAQSRLSSGIGLQTDLMRAKGIVGFDRLRKIDTQTELNKCRKDLANIIGVPQISDKLEALEYSAIHIDTSDPFMKTGIDDRADVKASLATIEAAKQMKNAAQSNTFPKISLIGEAGVGGASILSTSQMSLVGAVGIQIKLPFLESEYFKTLTQQSAYNLSKAELQARQVRIEAEGQIDVAIEKLRTTKTAADLADEQVELAKEELKIIQNRFRLGSSSGPDLATSQNNLSNMLLNQIDVIFANEVAKVNYYRSISEIDSYLTKNKVRK